MVLIWGSRLYGKVDVVPGLFHVATQFGHLYYFPLIPRGSYLVLSETGEDFQGVRIPISPRSMFLAWIRALLAVASLVSALYVVGMATARNVEPMAWVPAAIVLAACVGALLILSWARMITHASYDRACQLGELISLNEAGRNLIEAHYHFQGVGDHAPFRADQ